MIDIYFNTMDLGSNAMTKSSEDSLEMLFDIYLLPRDIIEVIYHVLSIEGQLLLGITSKYFMQIKYFDKQIIDRIMINMGTYVGTIGSVSLLKWFGTECNKFSVIIHASLHGNINILEYIMETNL